jgi:hypothetical protein
MTRKEAMLEAKAKVGERSRWSRERRREGATVAARHP